MSIAIGDSLTDTLLRAVASKINAVCQGIQIRINRQMTGAEEGIVVYVNDITENIVSREKYHRVYDRSYSIGITLYNQNNSDKTLVDSAFFDVLFAQLDSLIFTFKKVEYELFISHKQGSSETFPCLMVITTNSILIKKVPVDAPGNELATDLFIQEILED